MQSPTLAGHPRRERTLLRYQEENGNLRRTWQSVTSISRIRTIGVAELRFRDALNYKPDQPDATFKLAESLNRLGKNDEAKQEYQAYLKIQPDGPYAERARIALQRLAKISAGKN
jgi:tetratricopeptide (TPR) repeat protein